MDDNTEGCPSISLERLTSLCKNEVFISDKILSSDLEKNRFSIICSVEKAHIAQVETQSSPRSVRPTPSHETPLVLVTRSNYDLEPMSSFLAAKTTKQTFVVVLLTMSLHIFRTIQQLSSIGLAHGNPTVETIGIAPSGRLPVLGDFSSSFHTASLGSNLGSDLVLTDSGSFAWPPERHLLRLLMEGNASVVSDEHIRAAMSSFAESASIMLLFTEEFRSHYSFLAEKSLIKWKGSNTDEFVSHMRHAAATWDSFSISASLLSMVGYGFTQSQYCNRPMIAYAQFLTRNIHPDPARRPSVTEACDDLNAILTGV